MATERLTIEHDGTAKLTQALQVKSYDLPRPEGFQASEQAAKLLETVYSSSMLRVYACAYCGEEHVKVPVSGRDDTVPLFKHQCGPDYVAEHLYHVCVLGCIVESRALDASQVCVDGASAAEKAADLRHKEVLERGLLTMARVFHTAAARGYIRYGVLSSKVLGVELKNDPSLRRTVLCLPVFPVMALHDLQSCYTGSNGLPWFILEGRLPPVVVR